MVSHHRYYGQTDNPSVHSGPEDSSTAISPVHCRADVQCALYTLCKNDKNYNVCQMLLYAGFSEGDLMTIPATIDWHQEC